MLASAETTGIISQDRKVTEKCWTHDIEDLVRLAGFEHKRGLDISKNPALGANGTIVKDWTEEARYQSWTEAQARELVEAVTHPTDGVLTWIRVRW